MNNSWTTGSLRSSNWSSWYSYASASLTKLKPPLSSLSSCFIEPTLFIIILTSSSKILCPVVHQSVNEHWYQKLRNRGCWQKSMKIKFIHIVPGFFLQKQWAAVIINLVLMTLPVHLSIIWLFPSSYFIWSFTIHGLLPSSPSASLSWTALTM